MKKLTKRAIDPALDDLAFLQLADAAAATVEDAPVTESSAVHAAASEEATAAEDNGADAWTDDPFMFAARFETLDDLAFWAAQLTDLTASYAVDPAAAIDGLGQEFYDGQLAELEAANAILSENGYETAVAPAEDNGADAWTDDPFMFAARFATLDDLAFWAAQLADLTASYAADPSAAIDGLGQDFYDGLFAELEAANALLMQSGLEPAVAPAADAAEDGDVAAEDNGADAWTDDPLMFGARFATLDDVAAWVAQIDESTAFAPEDAELGIEANGGDFYYDLMAERAGAVQYLTDHGYVL